MGRLNVVSGSPDRELDAIRHRITSFDSASGLDDVLAILRDRANRGDQAELFDAVGHSREGLLVIGTWVIDDSPQTAATFSELLGPSLKQMGIRTIRLLGCSTATMERGWNAMRRIARATGCEVFGTKRYASLRDYGPEGFRSDECLAGTGDGRPRRDEHAGLDVIRPHNETRARSS